MSTALIRAAAEEAGLSLEGVAVPTLDIVGKPIDTGDKAHAFAGYIRIHALEASGGLPYSQLPRFATADGKGTNDAAAALQKDGAPVSNPVRNTWVTATALSTALNTAYMAEKTALFSLVVGIALLLAGIGFGILAIGGALRNPELALGLRSKPAKPVGSIIPTA
jgi:F0F1-type ATP synthase membrane subunit c/vacuolar-type H+-ATPase subunit K